MARAAGVGGSGSVSPSEVRWGGSVNSSAGHVRGGGGGAVSSSAGHVQGRSGVGASSRLLLVVVSLDGSNRVSNIRRGLRSLADGLQNIFSCVSSVTDVVCYHSNLRVSV